MTIRLDGLSRWKAIQAGEQLRLAGDTDDTRRVRLQLNCEETTWVYCDYAELEGPAQFLAAVGPGPETIEFFARGDLVVSFHPSASEGEQPQVWLFTSELEPNVTPVHDAVSFTEIVTRRARNPELEMMQAIARHNQRQMDETLARQSDNIARLEAMLEQKVKTNEPVNPGTTAGGGAGEIPRPNPDENGEPGGAGGSVKPAGGDGAAGNGGAGGNAGSGNAPTPAPAPAGA